MISLISHICEYFLLLLAFVYLYSRSQGLGIFFYFFTFFLNLKYKFSLTWCRNTLRWFLGPHLHYAHNLNILCINNQNYLHRFLCLTLLKSTIMPLDLHAPTCLLQTKFMHLPFEPFVVFLVIFYGPVNDTLPTTRSPALSR